MRISARDTLRGTVAEGARDATAAHVKIDIGGAVVPGPVAGADAHAVIKAPDVMGAAG